MTDDYGRKKVDDLKNGIAKIEQFDRFKKLIASCAELDLFLIIDQIGYIIWRTEHDLADGRIEYKEWDENDKYVMQAEIELAVGQSNRFGVRPFENDSVQPTQNYFKWYRCWKSYVESMSQEEWQIVSGLIDTGKDYSKYRPSIDWRE